MQIFFNHLQNGQHTLGGQMESVAVTQIDHLRGCSQCMNALQLGFDLLQRQFPIGQMLKEQAESTGIITAADSNRQHIGSAFHGTAADPTFIFHKLPSLDHCAKTGYLILFSSGYYPYYQVSNQIRI